MQAGEFPGSLVIRIQYVHHCGPGLTPAWGTEILKATWCGKHTHTHTHTHTHAHAHAHAQSNKHAQSLPHQTDCQVKLDLK